MGVHDKCAGAGMMRRPASPHGDGARGRLPGRTNFEVGGRPGLSRAGWFFEWATGGKTSEGRRKQGECPVEDGAAEVVGKTEAKSGAVRMRSCRVGGGLLGRGRGERRGERERG